MDRNCFQVDNIEYSFDAARTPKGWITKVVQTNRGKTPIERSSLYGNHEFPAKTDALAFAENLARGLVLSHLKKPPL